MENFEGVATIKFCFDVISSYFENDEKVSKEDAKKAFDHVKTLMTSKGHVKLIACTGKSGRPSYSG